MRKRLLRNLLPSHDVSSITETSSSTGHHVANHHLRWPKSSRSTDKPSINSISVFFFSNDIYIFRRQDVTSVHRCLIYISIEWTEIRNDVSCENKPIESKYTAIQFLYEKDKLFRSIDLLSQSACTINGSPFMHTNPQPHTVSTDLQNFASDLH